MFKDFKKIKIFFVAIIFGLYVLYSCIGTPLYDRVYNDVILGDGILPFVLSSLNTLFEL